MRPREFGPIRIGGKDQEGRQRTAAQLEVSLEAVAAMQIDPELTACVDWEGIAAIAGFNRRERAVWFYCWQHGQSAGMSLGLTIHQEGAANREIFRKIRRNWPAVQGLLGWADDLEKKLWVTGAKTTILGLPYRSYMLKNTIALNEKLAGEILKLDRLRNRIQSAEGVVREAEDKREDIERVLQASRVQAALAEREWPDQDALRKLTPARAVLAEARAACDAARQAGAQQEAIVERTRGEIFECRMEAFEQELGPRKVRYHQLLAELAEEAAGIRGLAIDPRYALNGYELIGALFPYTANSEDSLRLAIQAGEGMKFFNAVLRVFDTGRSRECER